MNDKIPTSENPLDKMLAHWLFPPYKHKEFNSDEEWKREHDEVSLTIRRQLFAIIMYSLFCILALGAPEIKLISNEADIKIPFSNTEVSYTGFLVFGPLILIGMTIYLHIFIGYLYELGVRENNTRLPFMFNLDSFIPRLITDFLFYWLVPSVLAIFAWKAIAKPNWQILISITAAVALCLIIIKIRRNQWFAPDKEISTLSWLVIGVLGILIVAPFLTVFDVLGTKTLFNRSFNFYGATYLKEKDLSSALLEKAILEKTDLSAANLSKANLRYAILKDADLSNANLQYADLTGADLRGANLAKAKLDFALLKHVRIDDATVFNDKWKLVWTIINRGWDSEEIVKQGSNSAFYNLSNVNFTGINLSFLNLSNADFSNSDFRDAVINYSKLNNASLKNIRNYKEIKSIEGTSIYGIQNAPDGFRDWAKNNNAVMDDSKKLTVAPHVIQDPLKSGGVGPAMVVIAPGRFLMGEYLSMEQGYTHGREEYVLREFAIGKYEVTVGEFKEFVKQTKYQTEAEKKGNCKAIDGNRWIANFSGRTWKTPGFDQDDSHPVVCVSWNDAQEYIAWLNDQSGELYRLPTEKEWEYVAREGETTSVYWDDKALDNNATDNSACASANVFDKSAAAKIQFDWNPYNCDDGFVWTAPVGSYKANKYGVHDMLGNVWEWVHDCFEREEKKIVFLQDLFSRQCDMHVFKGGSWHYGPGNIYSGLRAGIPVNKSGDLDGFRLARDIKQKIVKP